jgi:hypothetical protein
MKNKITIQPTEKPQFYYLVADGKVIPTPHKSFDLAQNVAIEMINKAPSDVFILAPILKITPEITLHYTNISDDNTEPDLSRISPFSNSSIPHYETVSGQGTNL